MTATAASLPAPAIRDACPTGAPALELAVCAGDAVGLDAALRAGGWSMTRLDNALRIACLMASGTDDVRAGRASAVAVLLLTAGAGPWPGPSTPRIGAGAMDIAGRMSAIGPGMSRMAPRMAAVVAACTGDWPVILGSKHRLWAMDCARRHPGEPWVADLLESCMPTFVVHGDRP